jgi:hypothetical protein
MPDPAESWVSWRDYVDSRFQASENAVAKATSALEDRFANTNEWRQTVESLQRGYLQRTEFDAIISSVNNKLDSVQRNMWVGIGLLLALQFFVGIAVIVWRVVGR